MGDLGVEDQNAALEVQNCTATRTQRQDQGSSACRACCPSTMWTGRWGAPCWCLAVTRSKQGCSIVTPTGLVAWQGPLCAWTRRPSPGSRTSCATAPRRPPALGLKTGARRQRWSWSSSESRRPPCARLPLRVHGAERQGVSRGSEGEGVRRGRGLVLLALALAGQWHQGAAQSEGEEHFQTGGADRRTKTIDLMSCKAHVAKLSDCSYLLSSLLSSMYPRRN